LATLFSSLVPRLEIASANGLWLHTTDGREVLDGVSGTFNLPLGYAHDAVEAAVRRQIASVSFLSSDVSHAVTSELVSRLKQIGAPLSLSRVMLRDVTGSTANEFAVKIAQAATGRRRVMLYERGHHGQTLAMTALSGSDFRKANIPAAENGLAIRLPLHASREALETALDDARGDVAALMIEPILGNGGNRRHPPDYFTMLRSFCDDHGVKLIVDEIQTGIGRVGDTLASLKYGIEPDVLTLAKGLGNGYPIGAVLYREELDVLQSYQHSFTAGGHLVSVAAANATIEEVTQPPLMDRVRSAGVKLGQELEKLRNDFRRITAVEGDGFMWGLQLVDEQGEEDAAAANQVVQAARDAHDLRLRSSMYGFGNVVKVRPALIASDAEIDEIIARLRASLDDVLHSSAQAL
jgi:4-aminobutyrate aminotransferase-like enzyme